MIKAFVFDAYGTVYDVQSVADLVEAAFPGRGGYITQVWRLKQLEYSWLRSMSGGYEDFWTVTRESLAYTLATLGLAPDEALLESVADAYNHLRPYADAAPTLLALSGYRRAILSNGSPAMLAALNRNAGLDRLLERTISVDAKRVYKPDPRAYELVDEELGVHLDEVVFVTSNGFDVMGAKRFGFRVARIERVPAAALATEIQAASVIGPDTLYRALRTQPERCGPGADVVISSLSDLPAWAETLADR